jgi:hypothetical protein
MLTFSQARAVQRINAASPALQKMAAVAREFDTLIIKDKESLSALLKSEIASPPSSAIGGLQRAGILQQHHVERTN